MRLLTHRLARAFPELDRFDDAQADAFCRAAVRQFWPRVVRWVVVGVCGCVAVMLAMLVAISMPSWIMSASSTRSSRLYDWTTVVYAVALIILFAIGFLLTMLLRDRLLRRRVRVVIRERGTCPRCKYVLLGQPVSADLRVSCPECGLSVTADPSMRELATDAAGRNIFQPAAPELDPALLARRAKRRRMLKLAAIWVPISTISAVLIAALAGWMFLLSQARRARAIVAASPARVAALMERGQPGGSTDADNQWTPMIALLDKFTAQVTMGPLSTPDENKAGATLDFGSLSVDLATSDSTAILAREAATRTYSRRVFDWMRASPLVGELRAFEQIPRVRFLRPWSDPGPSGLSLGIGGWRGNLPQFRGLARFNAARMHQAISDNDRESFEQAMAQNLAIGNGLRRQTSMIETLVAIAIDALTLSVLEQRLPELAERGWLELTQRHLGPMLPDPPPDLVALPFEATRLEAVDAVARFFSDPGQVAEVMTLRTGIRAAFPGGATSLRTAPWHVGTLATNTEPLETEGRNAERWVALAPADRPRTWMTTTTPTRGFAVGGAVAEAWVQSVRSVDQLRLSLRGVYMLTAIERYRARVGSLPATLADLGAADGVTDPGLLADPYSKRPLGYRVGESPKDVPRAGGTAKRYVTAGYCLYSVGMDGVDNNCKVPTNLYEALQPVGGGTDYVFGVRDR